MNTCIRCYVAGKVQGVFFRDSTRQQARALDLTGYARNLPDGRVEVVACGLIENISQLKEWLITGPDAARVDTLECEEIVDSGISGFSIY